jgi:hypothetical protein
MGIFLVEFVRPLTMIKDNTFLELVFRCLVIPPDIPPPERQSSDVFDDAHKIKTVKNRCTLDSHFDELRHHLMRGFF